MSVESGLMPCPFRLIIHPLRVANCQIVVCKTIIWTLLLRWPAPYPWPMKLTTNDHAPRTPRNAPSNWTMTHHPENIHPEYVFIG